MKETSPIVYNELAKTHSPANSDVVISPKHIKVDEDSKNLLKNSSAGLSVTVADIVSEDAGNKLREGADGRLYGAATEASELISARDDNQITLGADDKLYVAPPTGQDVLSKEEDNLLRHGNDKGVYLNGRDVLSNDGQNHLTVSDVDKRVTFIPDYKEWVSGDRNNALSTADDGKIFLDKKDLCHCEMTIPEGVTVVSQDPDNVLSTGSEGGAYLGSDDVCKVVNQQIEGGCIEVVSNTGGNLLTEGLDHRSYLGCNTIEDAIQRKCIRVVSPNRDNVLSTDSAGRAFLGCEAADRLITQGCMGLKSGQEGNLLTEDDEHRLVLDKLAVNSTAEQGITDGDITVVSKDEGNVLTEGTDKRAFLDCSAVDGKITDGCINVTSTDDANLLTKGNDNRSYLGKAAVNSTVEQGITSGDVTVVSTDEENLLTKGSSDNRAYLGKTAVNTTVEAGITAGDVTVVSTDANNILSAGADNRAYLKCETVNEKVTEGCIDVVSTDDKNLITAGSDNRAMLSESAVNAAVEQGITDGAVTVVSKDADNLLTEGTEDKRAYLSKDAVCTAINDNIASGCVDLVSPDAGNLITKDASGKVYLNCDAVQKCLPEQEDCTEQLEDGLSVIDFSTTYTKSLPADMTSSGVFAYDCTMEFKVTGAESGGAGAGRVVKEDGSVVLWIGASPASRLTDTYSVDMKQGDYFDVTFGKGGAGGAAVTDDASITDCMGQRGTDTTIIIRPLSGYSYTFTVEATSPGGEFAVEDGHGARGSSYAEAGFPMWFPSEDAADSIATNFTTATVGLSGTGGGTIVNKVPSKGATGADADIKVTYTIPDKERIEFFDNSYGELQGIFYFSTIRKLVVCSPEFTDICMSRSLCYKFDPNNSDNLTKTSPSYISSTVAVFDIPEDVVEGEQYTQFLLIPSSVELSTYVPVSSDITFTVFNDKKRHSPDRMPSKDGDFKVLFALARSCETGLKSYNPDPISGTRGFSDEQGLTYDMLKKDGYEPSIYGAKAYVIVGVDGIDFDKYDIACSSFINAYSEGSGDYPYIKQGIFYIGGGLFVVKIGDNEFGAGGTDEVDYYDATLPMRFARRLKGSCTWEYTEFEGLFEYGVD